MFRRQRHRRQEITAQELTQYWEEHYPDCPQIAHMLRSAYPDRWVRFHSLPESKRYPEDSAERETVLYRHNAVLGELAHPGDRAIVVTVSHSESIEPMPDPLAAYDLDMELSFWRTIAMTEVDGDEEPRYCFTYFSEYLWRPGTFDGILGHVAADELAGVIFVLPESRALYAPYDGGADVILENSSARDALRERHRDWLSSHPLGL